MCQDIVTQFEVEYEPEDIIIFTVFEDPQLLIPKRSDVETLIDDD
jgi:hypothetical protein